MSLHCTCKLDLTLDFFQGLEHIKLLERLNLYPFITALGQVLHQFHYF